MSELEKSGEAVAQPKLVERKPRQDGSRPPSLEEDKGFGGGRRLMKDLDAEIEREMEEAMGGLSAKDVYGEPAKRRAASEGPKKLVGKVLRVHGADVFVDVPGGRGQGVLPMTQFPDGPPPTGMEVDITIERYDGSNGLLLLSRKGQAQSVDWSSVTQGMTVEALVTGTNKAGLEVKVNGIRGFMPISQIDLFRIETLDPYLNQRLLCEVTEVSPEERNLIVSRRNLLEREREENRARLWNELAEGQTRSGVVRQVKEFGAFVDLGGVDGLLHVSEMSWQRVRNPADIVQPGQTLKVVILKLDRETRKVSLGLKQLTPSPWDDVDQKYMPGARAKGKVSRIMEFGAFVELEPAVEGLIHISELATTRVRRITDVVKPDQEVEVVILGVDKHQRRISLSLKAALAVEAPAAEPEAEEPEEEAPPPKPRVRTTPLRGGVGEKFEIPQFKNP